MRAYAPDSMARQAVKDLGELQAGWVYVMKIVLDLQGAQSHSRFRGIGRYSLLMARAFAEQASQHEIWLMLNGRHDESSLALIKRFEDVIPAQRVIVNELPPNIAGCQPGNEQRALVAAAIQANFLANLNADCIWHSSLFEGWGDDSTAALGSGADDDRHVATLYDLIPLLNPARHLHDSAYRRWYFRRLGLLKRCGLLLAISDSSRREVMENLQIPADRVAVISGAADPLFSHTPADGACWDRWQREWRLQPGFLLYAGGYDAHKNVDALVAAFAQLAPAMRRQHSLVLAGRCEESIIKRLRSLARKHQLDNASLIFTRGIDDAELSRLYSSCALFVAPSLHEGLGLTPLEAMACGAAVIGSNTTSLPHVIGRADALFDPRSQNSIAAKLHEVLTTPGMIESLQRHAQVQSRKFSWQDSARRALAAIEQNAPHAPRTTRARPRLIYVSPLPPVHSGIADYSARLLRELANHYEIDVVVDQPEVVDDWIEANFPIRSLRWFFDQGRTCERVLYHFGNSPFHAHMFGMSQQHPGVVVLHDSWLGAARNWMAHDAGKPDAFLAELYDSHGFAGLHHERTHGRASALDAFPVSRDVINHALGVIVHSRYAVDQARLHYGKTAAGKFTVVPFPRQLLHGDRRVARRLLGIGPDDFLVCSFGMLAPTKLNDRLLAAWFQSSLSKDGRCHLVFVGENHGGDYGQCLRATMQGSRDGTRVHITGFVSETTYADYLAAADLAVQLRTASRGETSAAVFDVLAHGMPLIVNAHGTVRELPEPVALQVPDRFTDSELVQALQQLRSNPEHRDALSVAAVSLIEQHHPTAVAQRYRDAIEQLVGSPKAVEGRRMWQLMERNGVENHAAARSISDVSEAWEASRPRTRNPCIYVDVTATCASELHTGIERVVRGVLSSLLKIEQSHYRIEPVRLENGAYLRVPRFGLELLGHPTLDLPECAVQPRAGDVLLGLDWVADALPANTALLDAWRIRGVRMFFVVYDLLPVQRPEWFPEGIAAMHAQWLQCIGRYADGLLSISRSVAADLRQWFDHVPPARSDALSLGYFYPGNDVAAAQPTRGLPSDAAVRLAQWRASPSFLMVGTIEPRKGHGMVLDAFEQWWQQGADANLIIVGREGWMSAALLNRIRTHPEAGKRLIWLNRASDEYLGLIYEHVLALVAASEGEGFGLPLVEADAKGLRVIARDIAVFREVSSTFATYFDGSRVQSLVDVLVEAARLGPMDRKKMAAVPSPTWQDSTGHIWHMLTDTVAAQDSHWLASWLPPPAASPA